MEQSEQHFKNYIKTLYPHAYVKKLPDFRQTASTTLSGMPDFLVIHDGIVDFYEVKYTRSTKTFNLKGVRESQIIEGKKMVDAGANVYFMVFFGKKNHQLYTFKEIYKMMVIQHIKSTRYG